MTIYVGDLGWCAGAVVLVLVLYLGFLAWHANKTVAEAPREEMFICPKHGPMSRKFILNFDIGTQKPIEYCLLCWNEKMKVAKNS